MSVFCKNCGCKVTRSGKSITRRYRHVYRNKYGNWTISKSYKNCEDPIPDKSNILEYY